MGAYALDVGELSTVTCGECHVSFAIPKMMHDARRLDGKTFYCPNEAMRRWGSEEDGIPDFADAAYTAAVNLLQDEVDTRVAEYEMAAKLVEKWLVDERNEGRTVSQIEIENLKRRVRDAIAKVRAEALETAERILGMRGA